MYYCCVHVCVSRLLTLALYFLVMFPVYLLRALTESCSTLKSMNTSLHHSGGALDHLKMFLSYVRQFGEVLEVCLILGENWTTLKGSKLGFFAFNCLQGALLRGLLLLYQKSNEGFLIDIQNLVISGHGKEDKDFKKKLCEYVLLNTWGMLWEA